MTIKELRSLLENLSDDTEVKVNSIQISKDELEPSEISEAHFDDNRGFVITPTVISLCKKNEYEEVATDNYKKHQEAMAQLSIIDIVKASDYINELASFIPTNNEVLDYLKNIQEPLLKAIRTLQTEEECPHCGCILYSSDLPQYTFVCPECNENF